MEKYVKIRRKMYVVRILTFFSSVIFHKILKKFLKKIFKNFQRPDKQKFKKLIFIGYIGKKAILKLIALQKKINCLFSHLHFSERIFF